MNECAQNRRGIANDFKKYRKVFIALGDETRQHIFIALLEMKRSACVSQRLPSEPIFPVQQFPIICRF